MMNEHTKKTNICVLEYYLSLEENFTISDTNEHGHYYVKWRRWDLDYYYIIF